MARILMACMVLWHEFLVLVCSRLTVSVRLLMVAVIPGVPWYIVLTVLLRAASIIRVCIEVLVVSVVS